MEGRTLRNEKVEISGVEYIPPIPEEEHVKEDLENILRSDVSESERAIDLFLYLTRRVILGWKQKNGSFSIKQSFISKWKRQCYYQNTMKVETGKN